MKIGCAILNWNTGSIVRNSVLDLIKECDQLVIMDNGSTRPFITEHYLGEQYEREFKYVYTNWNQGFSIGKNMGIDALDTCDYVFLLNGDIKYVPGTIELYLKILNNNPKAFCVGMFDFLNFGTVGIQDEELAAQNCGGKQYRIVKGLPVSWAHYGLYRGDVFFKYEHYFPTQIPFDKPGHGYEDDWHFYDITNSRGVMVGMELHKPPYTESIAVDGPTYYHDQIISKQSLDLEKDKYSSDERRIAFEQRWGKKNWYERYKNGELDIIEEIFINE